jgi:hypothetical protein
MPAKARSSVLASPDGLRDELLGGVSFRYSFPQRCTLRCRQPERDVNGRLQGLCCHCGCEGNGVRDRRESPEVLADARDVLGWDHQSLAVVESEPHVPSRHGPSIGGAPDGVRTAPAVSSHHEAFGMT